MALNRNQSHNQRLHLTLHAIAACEPIRWADVRELN